jgi:hypothetical protein
MPYGGMGRLLPILAMVTVTQLAVGQKKPKLFVTDGYVGTEGHYNRAADEHSNSSVRIECWKTSMECIEVIAVAPPNGRRASIDLYYYKVTDWMQMG